MVVLPGLVDLNAHLPQLPNAGLGSGLLGDLGHGTLPTLRRGPAPAGRHGLPATDAPCTSERQGTSEHGAELDRLEHVEHAEAHTAHRNIAASV